MLLNINNLSVNLGGLNILHDINLNVNDREIVVVVGANGAGKSTLMRTIIGLNKASSGTILFENKEINTLQSYERANLGISLVPEGRMLFSDMTVLENLQMGAYPYRKNPKRVKENLEKVFDLFPVLYKNQNRKSNTFSGGEQQMISIGRGLMGEPKLLMIDELSLGLAQKIIDLLLKTVQKLLLNNISVLMVEQNVRQALKIANRAYVLDNGSIVLSGSGEDLLNNDHVQKAYMGL
ncbi:MAG: ABC transporter ATP-binding protein [Clostridiaceae bacterium]|jgi:branched-chain amino acid transport system ATP-binding protein|nr:ABC transporter ATP-binding protein [Clostridiaceae bacterium]